ncbi:MAG: Nudix family hydrolase [Burkholderiales bacterium]|nr:Nudix family hydrolase [Burkholderiales bacterium]
MQVVAGVVTRDDGRFLLAQRPAGKVYAGYWEFPGGKIESGEASAAALARELDEELGIEVRRAYPWITRRYVYAHATVDLNFFRVVEFRGEPRGRESQALAWQSIEHIDVDPILPANGPILAAMRLPSVYAITDAAGRGVDRALLDLDAALARGLRLIQVREPRLSRCELRRFAAAVVQRAHASGARVVVNADVVLAQECAADGVHLKSAQLRALRERPAASLVAASCHDAEELALAHALGADFVVLGPVAPTLTHPGAEVLGWERFAQLLRGYALPAFALGGMRSSDLQAAWCCGGHGIAMQRAAWTE